VLAPGPSSTADGTRSSLRLRANGTPKPNRPNKKQKKTAQYHGNNATDLVMTPNANVAIYPAEGQCIVMLGF